ncbi:uncharacterized protein LOC142923197 [Petromyzon marinus]|uniref:uncharacterized protein LOC142923197 n=1 Tax=Petromyzon marinus TaxID=7757 RepID=UPI003F709EC3
MRDLFTNQEVQQTELDNLRHEALELQQRLQEANACCEETGNSLEQQTDFLKAELGVSRAEEAARAQEVVQLQHSLQHTYAEMECMHGQIAGLQHQLKESEGHVQALGMEKAQQQDAHRKEACELATGLEEVRLTLADAFKQFERNSKKAQEDEDTITRLREELKASKEELAASEAEHASAQPELSTPQQGLSALQDQLTTSQAENEDTLRQVMLPASFPRPLRTQALLAPERPRSDRDTALESSGCVGSDHLLPSATCMSMPSLSWFGKRF